MSTENGATQGWQRVKITCSSKFATFPLAPLHETVKTDLCLRKCAHLTEKLGIAFFYPVACAAIKLGTVLLAFRQEDEISLLCLSLHSLL